MDYLKIFEEWKNEKSYGKQIHDELALLDETRDAKEIEDRFYKELEFGTAGLRGIMGAGTNRMNFLTVGKATVGFGKFLLEKFGNECLNRGVVICFDTRNNSEFFSKVTANVLSSLGIKVLIFKHARPIPELSYAIRKFGAVGGVMVTASHNPKEYNGYKVYDETGCQLTPDDAKKVTEFVNAVKSYSDINFEGNKKLIKKVDITNEFVSIILKQSRISDREAKANLKVVYTPLHGAGFEPVKRALKKDGFNQVFIVKEQAKPNGDFPTVVSPNPEDRHALELGIKFAETIDADIVIGTDPDSDRVGVAANTTEGFKLITGNQMGSLILDFILTHTDLKSLKPAVIKTIVTSNLSLEIAKKYGVKVFNTLTGFKYIGERINQFEKAKAEKDENANYDFLLGYEESYGYLIGTHARDKDAVVSSMIIAELAAELKSKNKTLIDKLNEIYEEFGYFLDCQDSFTLKGKEGLEKIQSIMHKLRISESPIKDTLKVVDYSKPVKAEKHFGTYPASDVLVYELSDGSWVAIRPSGTEPKIKIYYSIKGKSLNEAEERQKQIQKAIISKAGLK